MNYGLRQDGNSYEGSGPQVDPFDLEVAFPAGTAPGGGHRPHRLHRRGHVRRERGRPPAKAEWSFRGGQCLWRPRGPQDRFAGTVNMAMFQWPAGSGRVFRLGYMGGP